MQRNSEEVLCRTLAKLLNSYTHADKRTCQQREKESNRATEGMFQLLLGHIYTVGAHPQQEKIK